MQACRSMLKRLLRDRTGATVIEYGLIVSLIFLAIVSAFRGVADQNDGIWARVEKSAAGAMGDE